MYRISAYSMTLLLAAAVAAAQERDAAERLAPPERAAPAPVDEIAPPASAAPAPAEEPAPPASAAPALAEEPAPPAGGGEGGDKLLSGMSIVGNDEAPKSLVIVPWKTSAMGHELDVSRALDEGRQPVDRDVFMRELEYYRIGVEAHSGGGADGR